MSDLEHILPTRRSLLSRLKDWDDQDSWRDFFELYWRLIFDVARKSGLSESDAQDVVQETILAVAKQMPEFRYDPTRGRFKSWLCQITRRRIADRLRRHYREPRAPGEPQPEESLESVQDPTVESMDALWEQEWKQHLYQLAVERVKRRVRPEHFQIFDLYVIQGWPVTKVAKALGVSLPLIYVTRHRIGSQLKQEIKRLQAEDL